MKKTIIIGAGYSSKTALLASVSNMVPERKIKNKLEGRKNKRKDFNL